MNNNKNKGFSLIEILAAVTILGILSAVAIISVNHMLARMEREYYETQKKQIILAAKSYTQDNRNFLPKRVGMRQEVTLSTLQNKKYIGKVVDRHKEECDALETKVQVYKYDQNNYSYSIRLVCPNYNPNKNEPIDKEGNITISYENIESTQMNYKDINANITMTDEDKIASYNYIIYRNEVEVKNSGDIKGNLNKELKITVPLESYLPGKITIKVIMTDYYGYQTVKITTKEIRNTKSPTCEVLNGENKVWTNKIPVEVSVKCISNTNEACQKDIYTQQFTTSQKLGTIDMEDKEGNKGDCTVNIYLDLDKPTTPVIENKYNNVWTNKNYTIKITSTDQASGIKQFEYRYPNSTRLAADGKPENEWHVWTNSSKNTNDETAFESTEFKREREEIVEVRAVDYAGNYSDVAATTIKIDKTGPVILNVYNPYLNTWFNRAMYEATPDSYLVTVTAQDNLSGISYQQYKYPDSTNTWVTYENSGNVGESTNKDPLSFSGTPYTADRDERVKLNVCDRAGNCTETESYIKIDKKLPDGKITVSNQSTTVNEGNGYQYNYGTINSKIKTITIDGSDYGSGLDENVSIWFNEASKTTCDYNDSLVNDLSSKFDSSGTATVQGPFSDGCRYMKVTIKDKAGNTRKMKILFNQTTQEDNNSDGCHYVDIHLRKSVDMNGIAFSWSNCRCGKTHLTAHYIICKYNGKYYDKRYYYRTLLGDSTTSLSPTFVCPDSFDEDTITPGETRGDAMYIVLSKEQSDSITWWPAYGFN